MSDFTHDEKWILSMFFENEIQKLQAHIPSVDPTFEGFVVERIEAMRTLRGKVLGH